MKSCISQHKLTSDNKADARILTDPNAEQRGWWEATEPAAPLELTELSSGLLQLLDLVLQDEHGHGERQQRQKLQLGRHHDSEQPHQIIQIENLVSPCSEEETLETHTHIHTHARTHAGVAVVTKRLSVCAWPCLLCCACVRISYCPDPLVCLTCGVFMPTSVVS